MTTDERIQKALESARKNDANNRDAARRLPGSSASGAGASGDRAQQALAAARQKDKTTTRTLTPSRTPSSTPASPLPSFATGSGNTVESVLGRFSGRGGVEAIKSPDSWSSAGDAELGLKAWSNQLDGYEKKLTELSGSIANTENRLKNLQTTVKTAEDAAAYDELYAGYEKMIADYNGVVNDINRVQDKYSAGVERYRDILSGGMERADAAAAEAKRLEDENSRLQQQANLIRIYEMSGTSSSSAAAPIEAQIEQNAQRIKELQAEESQNKMQYYSSLALMEDYAGLSSPTSVTGDSRYEYINDIDNARYRNEHTTDPSGAPVALRRYQYLTEDEIKIYNYLYASQGKDAADRFLEDMGPALTERQGAAQYEELGALGKALYWIPAGLDQFGSGIRQLFQREAVPVSSTQITSQLIQQEAQEKSPVLGTLYTLGTTLSNMAPSILASALGSWALGAAGLSAGTAAAVGRATGAATLGASAGGNAYTQKLNEGYSSEAAQNYATLVGASEGALQYLLGGIGALSKSGTGRIAAKIAALDNALGRVARTVSGSTAARLLGSMISEGTEEGLQELLEPAFAAIIFDEEYEADFEDAAYAFLLGALSAGIIEGPATIAYARRPAGFSFRDMDGYADNGVDYFEGANTLEEVEARYRDLARQYHPDVGGDTAIMAEINRQRTMARAFFRGRAEAAVEDNTADTTPEAAANTERADGVTRRLTAGRATEETTPETAGAQIESQTGAEAGGIVLPTADSAGDFSPRVEVGETVAPTLEAPRAAAPETNAAGNIVLPTADEIMNGGISNGQQEGQRPAALGGDGGRNADISAGGQAGRLGGSAEVRTAPAEQGRAALARQNSARDLRLQEVSSAELGIPEGTDTRNVRVLPETDWDDVLISTAEQVRGVTGREVRYVLGSIEVRTTAGETRRVRGVWQPSGDIIIQADNLRVSPQQIADHEIYHELAAQDTGLDYTVEERIREQFGEEEFARVVETYIQKLHGIVDLPANASESEFETALARIKQEIFADAYAGINAFGAHAERFADPTRETVKERTGIRSRENDDATRDRTGPPAERYSYAGTNAANADLEALEVAKGMAEQNVSAETIRQATGWFQGADGKWRFEIDDSGMRYSARGDLNYGDPDYWRYRELLDKLEREMLGTGSEAVTEAERAEYEELAPRYRDFYRQPGVRGDGSATASRLSDYIQHDELFEQYPQLRDARLVFEDMEDGKQGSYNPDTNTITLSESLQNSERDDALVHEIQHAIQEAEGFARGASPQYWARREYESGDLVGERLRREHDNLFRSLSQEEQNQFTRYRELDRELNRTMFAELGTEEAADYERYEAEQDALYAELYGNEWFRKLLDLERRLDDIPGEYRAMYSNTSGEIEARDAEARRKLTADERRAAPPDLGNEDTIFAQSGAGVQASIDYDTDNRPYVTVEEDILDGVPERDWARTVKAVLREKFPDGITVGNSEINIGGRTGRELTWSGTSRWMRANDPVAFADKYRTANNADELLLASTDYVNEGLDHPRRDDITDFSRGKVQFRIGDRDYTADVIVAALKDGRLMLYDITHLTRTEIQNRSQPRRSTNPSPGTASYTATDSDNSISASGDNVNARFSYDEELPRPVIAKQDLRRRLLDTFSVPPGSRAELGRIIEGFADKMIRSGRYTEQDRSALFDKLYDAGAMTLTADPYYSDARGALVKRRMYVSDALKAEFGDDWNDFRKRAFAAGIYLTNNSNDMAPDMWQVELGETLPGLFDADNLDMRSFMERVVQVAEEGRDEQVSLAEYTQMLAGENYVSEDEVLQDLEQRVDWELRSFAEKADLEVRLRGRGADGITNTERKRIIQEERANYWQLHKQYQEETRQRIAEERGKRHASEREAREKINNIIREEREKYWQKRRDYQQRADERVRQERERRWAVQAETRRRIDDVEQGERRTYYERLERYKEARRATDARERERRKAMSERRRETAELRSLQQRTLKQIQWLAKNQYRAPAELKQQWDEVLGDLDIFAVSAANEMNYSKKYDATWRDLAEMYKKARDTDPNFLPSQELERIVARLDNDKIGDLDIGALQDLYKAAVGLRQEFYNRNHVIGDEEARLFSELYADSKEEINSAPGGYSKNPADKVFNLEQLTPMNYLERMAGWNPDSAWYSMAKQLEAGERNERAYIVQANALLADWLEENEEWVLRSDGQGKDAVWYEVEVPELLELGMGDKPVFGDSVKVWMTPSMKVHLYLESKNYDNLRHMVGGRTFPDKELYSDGKRQEAFAQGKTIRLAPETVKKLVSDLAPEERELAALLERYYNQFAAERINKVSNALYGYDRAVTKNYAPIYTNSNYNQKEIGKSDQTAEGVGNMKQRIRGAKNPSYNLSAYDAFERHVDQTARFVGMAIPARNWKTLLNWRERNDSMSDVITHKWGNESLKYITDLLTDLQGGSPLKAQFQISSFADKLWSNYISAVFGANPSIVLKQLGSIPLGGAYLGMNNVPSPGQIANIDRELISRYTSELDWRLMGYATPETKQLKDHPNWTQRNSFFRNVFGGGAITGMDGWAASTLWPWAENKVRREQPELEAGTQEQIDAGQSPFYKAVAAEFDNAVNRSQSMSDTLHNARIRKSDNAVLRTLTMFKSDAAQTYNAFRQTIGEAQYYKRKGADSKTQRVARAATGAAFLAWIINAAWTAGVNFLVNLAKKKGANYRDDEDELTAHSVLGNMASDMLNGMSGVVIPGEELAGAIGSAITGERWYGLDTLGIEQLNDTLESLINSGNSIKRLLGDTINIGQQGGDVLAYLNEHRADLAGGIKEVAATAVTYFPGLPVNNVEAYLAGLLSWTIPSLSTSYEDLFETPDKASLSGLEGDALVTRVEDILASRLEDVSEPAAQTVATLYAAGYTEALPSGIPKQVTVTDKKTDTSETVELDAYQQQFFGQVWTETVGRAVDELVLMPEFEAASPEDQAKMLSQIYRFANETAKAETVEKYSPPSTMAEAAEDIASGRTLAEWAAYDVLSDNVSGTFGKLTDEGLDYEQALDVAETLDDLGDDATSVERYLAVARMPLPEDEKELALRGVMTDSAYAKYETARSAGIDTLDYCEFLDRISDISGDGRQERVWALIDSMRLTNRQKDVLHLAAGYKDSTLSKTPWHN